MKKKKRIFLLLFILCLTVSLSAGCADEPAPAEDQTTGDQTANDQAPEDQSSGDTADLSGKTLHIYCGAGMTKPFEEIAKAFEDETGCGMEVVYANAAQIHTQINTAQEGDLFVAGSAEELAPIKDFVSGSKDLVKHIPVLAVQKGNPEGITGLNDLAKEGIEVVLGDAEATPIGKLSDKALTDLGILEKVNVIARSATAPELVNALSLGECDAVIVWKENAGGDKIEIVDTTDLDKYIKTVPAASLTFNTDPDTLGAFLEYLDNDAAKAVWAKYGYEVLN